MDIPISSLVKVEKQGTYRKVQWHNGMFHRTEIEAIFTPSEWQAVSFAWFRAEPEDLPRIAAREVNGGNSAGSHLLVLLARIYLKEDLRNALSTVRRQDDPS
jgi:hypothetical protein